VFPGSGTMACDQNHFNHFQENLSHAKLLLTFRKRHLENKAMKVYLKPVIKLIIFQLMLGY